MSFSNLFPLQRSAAGMSPPTSAGVGSDTDRRAVSSFLKQLLEAAAAGSSCCCFQLLIHSENEQSVLETGLKFHCLAQTILMSKLETE